MFFILFEMKHKYLILSCFLFFIICSGCKKDEGATGTLSGMITNEFGNGIDKATITLGTKTMHSNFDGSFSFSNVTVGKYTINISKTHFLPVIQTVEIKKNQEATLNVSLKAGEPVIKISDSIFEFSSLGGTQKLVIECNAGWVLENSKTSWYNCTDSVGSGNGTISINCSLNKTSESRQDSISISTGTLKRKIIIRQASKLIIESVTGIIGNLVLETSDSILVCFNKAVTVVNIINKYEMCYPDIKFRMLNNNKAVEFTYGCAKIGMEYPLTIKIIDEKGNAISMDIVAKFYDYKLEFPGSLTRSVLSPDEKSIWLITMHPNKLFHISADSLKIISTTDLDYPPWNIAYNMYNNLLYISSYDPAQYYYDDHIYVHNTTGEFVKSIKLKNDFPGNAPAIYSSHLCFASNGYGVILVGNAHGGYLSKIINSAENDSIYMYPQTLNYIVSDNAYLAYDNNRILLKPPFPYRTIGILDATTHQFSTFDTDLITGLLLLAPSKIKDEVYFANIYDQCIMSLDDHSSSKISYLDCRFNGSADFAYRDGEEKLVFYCDDNYLRLLDYTNAATLMKSDNIYNLRNFNVTKDGSTAYAYTWSRLLKFNTSMFFRNTNKLGVKNHSEFTK